MRLWQHADVQAVSYTHSGATSGETHASKDRVIFFTWQEKCSGAEDLECRACWRVNSKQCCVRRVGSKAWLHYEDNIKIASGLEEEEQVK